MDFQLSSNFTPAGDQPQAIRKLIKNIKNKEKYQTLVGVTGSGKTFSMANTIAKINKPTLIISHNKTLAAQLYQEFRDFFPNNVVCYFVSYYDYYQPEAYIPQSDTYIEKEAEINDEIDRLRLSATANLLTRNDVIIVASVSCIYNLGSPIEYEKFVLKLKKDVKIEQRSILDRLTSLQYSRNEYGFNRGTFRVRGESVDIFPAYTNAGIRIDIIYGKVSDIYEFDPLTGDTIKLLDEIVIYPAKHYMTDPSTYDNVFPQIRKDLQDRVNYFKSIGKIVEAQRIEQRTNFDLEMIREVGFVNGIENYSPYFDGRKPGEPPYSLLNYMDASDKDWLLFIDESHITIPQIRGMYNGDRSRKETLIEYGFRLPSALDNRPLRFDEFMRRVQQVTFVSATPSDYELSLSSEARDGIVEQLIRPTGLVDPNIYIRPTKGQINDLVIEIQKCIIKNERVLIITLTKRMSEDLTSYLQDQGIKVAYLHSDIKTLYRQDILDSLRFGEYDVLIGINLLREGLDLPEVSLVAILDADKEGFLRSKTSLIQIMGRAARNINAKVIMYADKKTKSMNEAISEVERRRDIQIKYNKKNNISPKGIVKSIRSKLIEIEEKELKDSEFYQELEEKDVLLPDEREALIKRLRKEMKKSAIDLDFETAMIIRNRIKKLEV
ncbi:UvrABC system protein B [Candidatus Levyibacteriota bacterium]|nr:excinuclease ABC subunit UvrB [Candidatus Levybacteria bacterium]MSU25900.1 excinuclease ABC subunit UvrB [Candidatus Levybacteria bacterium]GDX61942.1 UvrABC system protein B [Candidatus Levybacteria bacterium]